MISYVTASIPFIWGYSRQGALPFQSCLSHIDEKNNVPDHVLYVFTFCNVLVGFIYLGTPTGYHIIAGGVSSFYYVGYIFVFLPILVTGRKHLVGGYFEMPWFFGMACAATGVIFNIYCVVAFSLPSVYPVTTGNMNWASVIFLAGTVAIALNWKFYARHHFLDIGIDLIESVEEFQEQESKDKPSIILASDV